MSRTPYATNQPKQLAEEEEIAGLPGDEDDVMVDDAIEEQGYGMYESHMGLLISHNATMFPIQITLFVREHVESSLCMHVTIHSREDSSSFDYHGSYGCTTYHATFSRFSSIVDPDIISDLDHLVLFTTRT